MVAPFEVQVAEQLVSPEGETMLRVLSDAFARTDSFDINFTVNQSPDSTFQTSCTIDEAGKITVELSPDLLRRAESEDRLNFLGFCVMHEIGHVKRFQAQPPKKLANVKDAYFTNVVDDIAINYGNAHRTRYVHDMTRQVYDDYLFPVAKRPELADAPRHKQLMESLLMLSMTTNAHVTSDTAKLLETANLSVNDDVSAAISDILAHEQSGTSFNLLGQLRAFGDDLRHTTQVGKVIRQHYDALYEADVEDQQNSSVGTESSGDASQSGGESNFDYSDSAGCGHGAEQSKESGEDTSDGAEAGQPSSETGGTPLDIQAIAEKIAEAVAEIAPDLHGKPSNNDTARDYTPEQLEKLRAELGLDESDFAGYMSARRQFAGEIRAVEDMLLQLRHERQNEFLAPGREVAARGHRIRVDKLMQAVASGVLGDQPDIWKHPALVERIEHEFDGLDLYVLCDISTSMRGEKAQAAASATVVLQEGSLAASAQMAGEDDTPVVRLQIQAFGAGHQILCPLTDAPSTRVLGTTYSALSNPSSGDTQVAEALKAIKPVPGRLSVVAVVSDGAFHDNSEAMKAGQVLADQNAAIIQMVFGGADVSKLANNAKRVPLNGAKDLPQHLLNMLPELIEILRSSRQ
jgi:hypothetical protein